MMSPALQNLDHQIVQYELALKIAQQELTRARAKADAIRRQLDAMRDMKARLAS